MGLRQTWRDYRTVRRELRLHRMVSTVEREVRAGRLTVGDVASATFHAMFALGEGRPREPDPVEERLREHRDRHLGRGGPGLW